MFNIIIDNDNPTALYSTRVSQFTKYVQYIILIYIFEPFTGAFNAGDLGSIPGLGRSPGGGHGNPF